jgi:hypothetical protein
MIQEKKEKSKIEEINQNIEFEVKEENEKYILTSNKIKNIKKENIQTTIVKNFLIIKTKYEVKEEYDHHGYHIIRKFYQTKSNSHHIPNSKPETLTVKIEDEKVIIEVLKDVGSLKNDENKPLDAKEEIKNIDQSNEEIKNVDDSNEEIKKIDDSKEENINKSDVHSKEENINESESDMFNVESSVIGNTDDVNKTTEEIVIN